ncbi:endonuclease/exonuclease/phosphatase family protein [Pseudooceanicola sp.]|uniref:endonuclease/exonuclease/phosphatase family protein n=1 Tax=Pseudooceanicola sp. TaxID=1914328 RepID=UPI0035161098
MRLKIASYNIRKGIGLDRRRRPDRILSVLNGIGADVAVLQEADKRLGARPTALPRFLIAQETDYQIADVAENDLSIGWHGNAILVRRGLKIEQPGRIALPGLEPRGAVTARIAGLQIVGTHLGLLRTWRLRQMGTILDHLHGTAQRCVVAGDFNEWSPLNGFSPWKGDLTVVAPGPSYHASRPIAPLDRFAHGRAVRLSETGIQREGAARLASDHLPVWAVAEVAAGAETHLASAGDLP